MRLIRRKKQKSVEMLSEHITRWRIRRHLRALEKNPVKHALSIVRIAERKNIYTSVDDILNSMKNTTSSARENLAWVLYEYTSRGRELSEQHFQKIIDLMKRYGKTTSLAFIVYKYAENFGLKEHQKKLVREVINSKDVGSEIKYHLSLLMDEIEG